MGNEVGAVTDSAAKTPPARAAATTAGTTAAGGAAAPWTADGPGAAAAAAAAAEIVGDALAAAVEQAVREIVAAEVLPRWRRLADADIAVKSGPNDLVTTADRLAEERLTERLTALLPGSLVVGEEAASADPGLLRRLHGDAPVWVIDPVDGTAAFVRGEDGFATMVALVKDGEPLASWTYGPRRGQFATARRGRGAHLDGRPLRTAGDDGGPLRVWTSNPSYRTAPERAALARLGAEGAVCTPCSCAGLAYLDVARGAMDAVAFFWELPWDHAAGLLLTAEAGGASRTAAGVPFRVAGGNALPFTAARDAATAERIIAMTGGGRTAGGTPAAALGSAAGGPSSAGGGPPAGSRSAPAGPSAAEHADGTEGRR